MKSFYTDRSRILQHQRCPRSRYEGYDRLGSGIATISKPLPLAVGGGVHAGIEVLLRGAQHALWTYPGTLEDAMGVLFEHKINGQTMARELEEEAVAAALKDFNQYTALEVDTTELFEMGQPRSDEGERIAKTLGLAEDDPQVIALRQQVGTGWTKFDTFLKREQQALVEALVRAYARRRLRPLLEEFEVLEVEREGQWQLHFSDDGQPNEFEVLFMSRPDALLRERISNQLFILSLKTAATWDIRKERDAGHDMQGLSEGVEVERRLGEWWDSLQRHKVINTAVGKDPSAAMVHYLSKLSAPPRIHAIRYEYMLKGYRKVDDDLTSDLGMAARTQRSHLVRANLNKGMAAGDEKWCWSWEFTKDDGSPSKLHYKSWKGTAVWEHMTTAEWIDKLDSATATMSTPDPTLGIEPQVLGYQCEAQLGFTETHPLDDIFLAPIVVYRNDDDLRDWIDATEAQETRVVEGLVKIAAAMQPQVGQSDEGYVRHLLNDYFPMHRSACEYPSTCAFAKICYGSEEIKVDPIASGVYERRKANHPQERGE